MRIVLRIGSMNLLRLRLPHLERVPEFVVIIAHRENTDVIDKDFADHVFIPSIL